jgi:hypothetical protein
MELTGEARALLAHLKVAPAAYLCGKRINDGSAFDLVDGAEPAPVADGWPKVPRRVVQELFRAGFLSERTELGRTVIVSYVLSEEGHTQFVSRLIRRA